MSAVYAHDGQEAPDYVQTSRVFKNYYVDLSKHPVLKPSAEHELLIRYRTCPHCQTIFPMKSKRIGCPQCGEPPPKRVTSRLCTCTNCSHKFEFLTAPQYCHVCGADRDKDARRQLIEGNLRFVVRMAKTFSPNQEQLLQLISAGNIGLMTAIDKFDVYLDNRFLTYAAWWIRKEMLDEINSNTLIHLPSHKQKEQRKIVKHGLFECQLCGHKTEGSSAHNGIPCLEGEFHEFMPVASTDPLNKIVPSEDMSLPSDLDIEELCIDTNTARILRRMLVRLNLRARDKFIVLRYYDIPTTERRSEPKSLPQLACITGITPERVRQIKERTLRELRSELRRLNVTEVSDMVV